MRATDEAEFREYMAARWPALVRTAYLLTGDRHSAEDLAQIALEKAAAAWGRVRRADSVDAYVRRILVNTHLSRFRRRRVVEILDRETPEVPSADSTQQIALRDELLKAGSGGERWVPVVTQQVGLAAGQRPMSGGRVIASGTVDGVPWQVLTTVKVDPAKDDPMFGRSPQYQKAGGNGQMTCVDLALWVAGSVAADSVGCNLEATPTVGGTFPYFILDGPTKHTSYLAVVPDNVTKAVWSGTDGFRQEEVPLATPFAGVKMAVFPDRVPLRPGDEFVDYDSAGKTIYSFKVPAGGLPMAPGRPS